MLCDFGNCQLMIGAPAVAYDIFENSGKRARETANAGLHAKAILSMAHCMWDKLRAAPPSGDAQALHAFGEHLAEAAAVIDAGTASHGPKIVARFVLLSAVHRRLIGEQTAARVYVRELLNLVAMGARNNCWSCGQTRNEDETLKQYRLKSCEQCRVAHFCNQQCQSRCSAGKGYTDVYSDQFVKHRAVCMMLRVHRNVPALGEDAELLYGAALTAGAAEDAAAALPTCARNTKLNELIHTFLDDLTADCARV